MGFIIRANELATTNIAMKNNVVMFIVQLVLSTNLINNIPFTFSIYLYTIITLLLSNT